MSSNNEILKFCKDVNIKFITVPIAKSNELSDLILHKERIKVFSKKIVNSKIIFTHVFYDVWGFYLMKTLNRHEGFLLVEIITKKIERMLRNLTLLSGNNF